MHPTPALLKALRRLPLTTKQGPHNYYKGNRTGSMGSHTKYGGYVIDWKKVRTYVCPDLVGFNLTPFVAKTIEKPVEDYTNAEVDKAADVQELLVRWKEEGADI